ncbi:unnamed protein product [Closterium sp. Yama58-4]|nr:unnamed protein product [Closterium sp. Yama58-4]
MAPVGKSLDPSDFLYCGVDHAQPQLLRLFRFTRHRAHHLALLHQLLHTLHRHCRNHLLHTPQPLRLNTPSHQPHPASFQRSRKTYSIKSLQTPYPLPNNTPLAIQNLQLHLLRSLPLLLPLLLLLHLLRTLLRLLFPLLHPLRFRAQDFAAPPATVPTSPARVASLATSLHAPATIQPVKKQPAHLLLVPPLPPRPLQRLRRFLSRHGELL